MNKAELIAKLASKTDITQVKAGEAIDAIFNATKGPCLAVGTMIEPGTTSGDATNRKVGSLLF